jgi:ribosome-binding factor A
MANQRRIERLEKQILRTISQTVLYELHDPRTHAPITFTRVKLAKDLSAAKIYFSVLGEDAARRTVQRFLDRAAGFLRGRLKEDLFTRTIPGLSFHYDPSIAHSQHINEVLAEIAAEEGDEPPRDTESALAGPDEVAQSQLDDTEPPEDFEAEAEQDADGNGRTA